MLTTQIIPTINMQTLPICLPISKILFEEFWLLIDKISICAEKLITFVSANQGNNQKTEGKKIF